MNGTCYYCGRPASDREHVIEKSILRSCASISQELVDEVTHNRKLIVSSCRECNALLVGTIQFTLAERKQFVKLRLRQKYGKLLKMPNWANEELEVIGRHLRGHIIRALQEKEIVKERISW
jgi:hypothetical protein